MGYTHWSNNLYQDNIKARMSTGVAGVTTSYTQTMSFTAPEERKINPRVDPKGVKFRESRDSQEHPTSVPVAVLFDQTGSMQDIPPVFQQKLGALMNILLQKGYLEHPQILFGAIGDARTGERFGGKEVAPLQVGQFESGVEMDDDLDHIFLEGCGGGQRHESYELAMYFMANHTSCDAYEKRGKKGYLFLLGDEQAYSTVSAENVERVLGYKIEADIPLEQVIEDLKQKWEVFFILPSHSQYGTQFKSFWQKLFGENVLVLNNPNAVAETIALAIGTAEGVVDLDGGAKDLKESGSNDKAIMAATQALAPYANDKKLVKSGTVSGTLPEVI